MRQATLLTKLRGPLVGALLFSSLAGAGTIWTANVRKQAEQENNTARQRKAETQRALDQMHIEAGGIEAHVSRFRGLQQSGMVGEEQRQQWAETLATLERQRQPQALGYKLGEKTLLGEFSTPDQSIFASRLELHIGSRHEIDFLGLLSLLTKELKAQSILRHCQLERQAENGLAARCDIELITFAPKT